MNLKEAVRLTQQESDFCCNTDKRERLGTIIDALHKSQKREKEFRKAIMWALGVNGEFPVRTDGAGPYWWRMELMRRAGVSIQELNRQAKS
ncbi:MAG: hypothetical protein WCS52_01795 [bacterium]